MKILKVPIHKINPAPYNPRKNLQPNDPEYQKLLKSLDEFDCVEPLVLNRRTGHLVGGHQRFKILKARGDKYILCSVVDLSPEKEKALNIALNKISGQWDDRKLAQLLDELIKEPENRRLSRHIAAPRDRQEIRSPGMQNVDQAKGSSL